MLLMQAQENGVALDEEKLLFIAGGQDNAVDEDVDEQPVQDLSLNVDNVFLGDDCEAFNSDVDEAPTAQTMFMVNLSSADPVYDKADPSYDSNILSEVHNHDHYQNAICEHHKVHEMHDDVQPNYIVNSHADYTCDSNMISYDQYVKDNAVPVVQSHLERNFTQPKRPQNSKYFKDKMLLMQAQENGVALDEEKLLFIAAPYVPPTNKELKILFQPVFDEYLEPPRVERPVSLALVVSVPANSAGTPSSTSIDQDAPSLSHSLSSLALQSVCLYQGVIAESTLMDGNPFAPIDNDPFINTFALEPTSKASSSEDASSAESTYVTQTLHHLGK
nr:retrovirus-related Pol polyprotein from transposon TNT 1-94 [Tanacetum cinerariifolium]